MWFPSRIRQFKAEMIHLGNSLETIFEDLSRKSSETCLISKHNHFHLCEEDAFIIKICLTHI